jgi:Ni/Fe-hydrogenase subunit HybB-like protein
METPSFDYYKKQRKWAASFLPIGGFLSAVFLWQSVMSVDPHWYSTMFAWYSTASAWLGAISLTVILIIYLKSKGYLEYVTHDHLHDVGKFLFGISVFWMYLWFDQFMLIWYANNGEETIYFKERMDNYPVLFWGNIILNFVTPFFILMRNDTKRKFGTMYFVAIIVFFGHWWDYFYMIKPGARIAAFEARELAEGGHHSNKHETAPLSDAHDNATEHTATPDHATNQTDSAAAHTADTHGSDHAPAAAATTAPAAGHGDEAGHGDPHGSAKAEVEPSGFRMGFTVPGLEEIGVMVGFLSLFLLFFFSQLERASLVPWKDPYLEESLHHETGALIETEQQAHEHDSHHH